MYRRFVIIVSISLFFCGIPCVSAQPECDEEMGYGDPNCTDPEPAPLDSGIIFLIAAATVYGIKESKIRRVVVISNFNNI